MLSKSDVLTGNVYCVIGDVYSFTMIVDVPATSIL